MPGDLLLVRFNANYRGLFKNEVLEAHGVPQRDSDNVQLGVEWVEGEGFHGRQARQPTLGAPFCPARGASAPTAQTFQEKDAIAYFKRLYGPHTSDSLSPRPAAEVGKPHLSSVGKPQPQ